MLKYNFKKLKYQISSFNFKIYDQMKTYYNLLSISTEENILYNNIPSRISNAHIFF